MTIAESEVGIFYMFNCKFEGVDEDDKAQIIEEEEEEKTNVDNDC